MGIEQEQGICTAAMKSGDLEDGDGNRPEGGALAVLCNAMAAIKRYDGGSPIETKEEPPDRVYRVPSGLEVK